MATNESKAKLSARNSGSFVLRGAGRPPGKFVLREAKGGEFTILRDGRKIVEPPAGGKLKKRDIERAVRAVVERRRASEAS